MKKLSDHLRKITTPAMTSTLIAKKMGVSLSTVSLWMNDKRSPSANKLKRLSQVIGIKIEDLL